MAEGGVDLLLRCQEQTEMFSSTNFFVHLVPFLKSEKYSGTAEE